MAYTNEAAERYAHIVEKQSGRAVRPYREDGYVNMLNSYGTKRDTSEHYMYVPEPPVPDEVLTNYYESNGLFAKIIDAPAEEALKHGFKLEGLEDAEIESFYKEALDELDWEETAMTAIKWTRLYGGAIAVLMVNDGRGLDEPLDWDEIQSIDDIRVYDRSLITPDYASMYNYDPVDPFRTRGSRLGMPEYYDVNSKYGNFRVHDSRCLVFQNGRLPENTSNTIYELWGVPEYIRLHRAIRDAEIAHSSASKMLDKSVQPVYKMQNLSAELATEEGESRVLRRLETIDMARGMLNTMVIDADGEEYDFRTFQFSGVNDVISASCNLLSAISNIPQVILFGSTVGGLSTTDDTSMENWYSYVERIQKRMLRSNLRYLLSIIFQAGLYTKEIKEIPEIKVEFEPLWSMSETEQVTLDQQKAQVQATKAQTATAYVSMQALDPSEVRKALAESKEFDVETMLDDYDEEELFENAPQGQEGGGGDPMAAMMGGGGGAPQGGDPMAAMMGGGGQPDADPTAAMAGGAAPEEAQQPAEPQGQQPKPEKPVKNAPSEQGTGESISEVEQEGEVDTGNSPAAAPAATKLPQDMTSAEKAKANGSEDEPQEKEKSAPEKDEKKKSVEETENTDENTVPEIEWLNFDKPRPVDKLSVGVYVISPDGKVLCGIREEGEDKGKIAGPGGHIEKGETPEEAAMRETWEEFGIWPHDLTFFGYGLEGESGLTPCLFLCTEYDGTVHCMDGEMSDPAFRSLKNINTAPSTLFKPFRDGLGILLATIPEPPEKAENGANDNPEPDEQDMWQMLEESDEPLNTPARENPDMESAKPTEQADKQHIEDFRSAPEPDVLPEAQVKELQVELPADVLQEELPEPPVAYFPENYNAADEPAAINVQEILNEVAEEPVEVLQEELPDPPVAYFPEDTLKGNNLLATPPQKLPDNPGMDFSDELSLLKNTKPQNELAAIASADPHDSPEDAFEKWASVSPADDIEVSPEVNRLELAMYAINMIDEMSDEVSDEPKDEAKAKKAPLSADKLLEKFGRYENKTKWRENFGKKLLFLTKNDIINMKENEEISEAIPEFSEKDAQFLAEEFGAPPALNWNEHPNNDGGRGSGNFGHGGRPGKIGGSSDEGSSESSKPKPKPSPRGINTPCKSFSSKAKKTDHHNRHVVKENALIYKGMTEDQYEDHAREFLAKPCSKTIDGYVTADGCVCRFDKTTGEYAKGYPGGVIKTCMVAKCDKKTGKANLALARNYFEKLKAAEGVKEKPLVKTKRRGLNEKG